MTRHMGEQVTVVKNQLVHPDGTPRRGVRVDFVVRANTTWRVDRTGRIVGNSSTWTNETGCWRAKLLPYTEYAAGRFVYVEVQEARSTSGYIQVPPTPAGEECWMGDLLIEPPKPSGWSPIATLADLHDIDRASIEQAPDGAILVKRDGKWVAEIPQFGKEKLAELRDVDQSVSWAQPPDKLEYLSAARGWGVNRAKPKTIHAEIALVEGTTVMVGVTDFDRSKNLLLYWSDGSDNTPVPAPGDYTHTFATSGTKNVLAYYDDQSEELPLDITIP